jgi:hypothetical protein
MDAVEATLEARARAAYERGRALWALRRALLVPPIAAIALVGCPNPGAALGFIGLLGVAVGILLWRGREYGRGVRPGLVAGAAPLALPASVQVVGHVCPATFCLLLPGICAVSGLIGGVVLGFVAHRSSPEPAGYWGAAVIVTALAGCGGCLIAGVAGIGGMALGLAAGLAPALALRAA